MYKNEKQEQNRMKLEELIKKHQIPDVIAGFFRSSSVKSKQALLNYFSSINNFLQWCLNEGLINSFEEIGNIKPSNVVDYLTYCHDKRGLKPSSVVTIQNNLSSFFNYLLEEEVIIKSPMLKRNAKLFVTKKTKNHKKLPSKQHLDILEKNLSKIPNDVSRIKYCTIYRVLKGSGLREIELCGLDMHDIHINEEYPYISIIRKGSYYESELENIYISNNAARSIEEWLMVRERLNPKSDALFLTRNGDRIKERNVIRAIKKYSEGNITPHMLRHLYATELYSITNDLSLVQEQCGHVVGSLVTLDVYTHGTTKSIDELVNM